MNIQSAAKYIKLHYRVRRTTWQPGEYIYDFTGSLRKMAERRHDYFNVETKTIECIYYLSDRYGEWEPTLEDLLADDWEIITSDIRKYFNKYKHLEYNDEINWANYEPDEDV